MIRRFPGLIDVHVHLRDPGATQKEDFITGSKAAVAGGFTYILDMPNNPVPTFSTEALDDKIARSRSSYCDIGFHYGTNGKNTDTFKAVWSSRNVFGLKLYCNHTTGDYLVDDPILLDAVFNAWQCSKPILVHAEGETLERVIRLASRYKRRLHVCHISLATEVAMVKEAKSQGISVTAGVCPHHLFLTDRDVTTLGSFAMMKPPLGTETDRVALWDGVHDGTIDLVETDHAPHTIEEKHATPPPYGVPGLETALGLLLKSVHDGTVSQDMVISLLYGAPKKIFSIPDQNDTYIELDPDVPYTLESSMLKSKCTWSPFIGWELYGKVQRVVIRGEKRLNENTNIIKEEA